MHDHWHLCVHMYVYIVNMLFLFLRHTECAKFSKLFSRYRGGLNCDIRTGI